MARRAQQKLPLSARRRGPMVLSPVCPRPPAPVARERQGRLPRRLKEELPCQARLWAVPRGESPPRDLRTKIPRRRIPQAKGTSFLISCAPGWIVAATGWRAGEVETRAEILAFMPLHFRRKVSAVGRSRKPSAGPTRDSVVFPSAACSVGSGRPVSISPILFSAR